MLLTQGAANIYASEVYNSVSPFWFNDPSKFIGVIQNMKTKTQVSYLSDTFENIYGKSMIAYLAGYLTPDQLAQAGKIVDALPVALA